MDIVFQDAKLLLRESDRNTDMFFCSSDKELTALVLEYVKNKYPQLSEEEFKNIQVKLNASTY